MVGYFTGRARIQMDLKETLAAVQPHLENKTKQLIITAGWRANFKTKRDIGVHAHMHKYIDVWSMCPYIWFVAWLK